MIRIQHVTKKFETSEGIITALNDVSFEIPEGKCTVIGGENGSGKSVLMSILSGLEDADEGEIIFPDEEADEDSDEAAGKKSDYKADKKSAGQKTKARGKKAGLVFQEAETQILGETPREDIAFGPKNLGWSKERISEAVDAALEKTGLTAKSEFPARFLSGGEKRRLAVACMIAMDLSVIILDEPFANLDYGGVKQVNALIKQLIDEGRTVIILTHELEKCLSLAEKLIVLFRGNIVFDGTPEEGLKQNLEQWNIRNPLVSYTGVKDLLW